MLRTTSRSLSTRVLRMAGKPPMGATAAAAASSVPPRGPSSSFPKPPPATSGLAAPVRDAAPASPITPPSGGVLKKKKMLKKLRQQRRDAAAAASDAHTEVNTGEALRRELRGIPETMAAPPTAEAEEGEESSTAPQKTPMVKGYRVEEVVSLCGPGDAIFARRLPSGGCQFFAWPGTPLTVASSAIVSMPDTIRTCHALFGRYGTPVDLVMDIDCAVPQEHWSMSKIRPFQEKLLSDVLSVVKEEIEKQGEVIEKQVVLQSPNLKKASFHVHTRIKDAAFADYRSLHGFMARFAERVPHVDMQIYRANGMLRMFSCMKENRTSAMVVFEDPKWNIGYRRGRVSDEEAALMSVCVREPGSFTRLLQFEAPRPAYTRPTEGAGGEEGAAPAAYPTVLLPRTEREAVQNASRWLRQATEVEVGEWRTWIGLGICAFRIGYHFRDAKNLSRPALEEMLDAWTEASRRCPLKYHQGECESRWASFDASKFDGASDWWGAYKRLGRLEVAAADLLREDAERRARDAAMRQERYQRATVAPQAASSSAASPPPPAAAAPAASPATAAAAPAPTPAAAVEERAEAPRLSAKKKIKRIKLTRK